MPAFNKQSIQPNSPWWNAFNITTGMYDVPLPTIARGIYVGGAGNLDVTFIGGSRVIFKNRPAGSYLLGFIKQVNTAGTTATDLIGGMDADTTDVPGMS